MADNDTKKDGAVAKLQKQVDDLAAKVRRDSENWKRFVKKHLDSDSDGKVGSARTAILAAIAIIGVCVLGVFGEDIANWDQDSGLTGTAKITHDGSSTYTLTIDAIAAAITGDITTDDINMSGGVSDTLGFNDTKPVTVTGLMSTVKYDIGGVPIDTDYINHIALQMDNDNTQSIDWAYWYYTIDDASDTTEDSSASLYTWVAGAAVETLDIGAGVNTMNYSLTAALLGSLNLKSINPVATQADDDHLDIIFQAYDSATAVTDYAEIEFVATDVTTATSDGGINFKVLAADATDTILALKSSAAGNKSATFSAGTEVEIDGLLAVTGPNNSTGQMVLGASITATGTTMTNTFEVAFASAPVVTCTYTEAATTNIYLGTITASNFISFHESSKNYGYTAVGARP